MVERPAAYWKLAALLGLASFLSFAYFYEGGGWNQNSRFDLLRAIVERHTLTIDAYHENTGTKLITRGTTIPTRHRDWCFSQCRLQ